MKRIGDVLDWLERDRSRRATEYWLGQKLSHPRLFSAARHPRLATLRRVRTHRAFQRYQQTLTVTLNR